MGFVNSIKGAELPFFWYDPEDHHESDRQLPMIESGTYQCVMVIGGFSQPVYKVENLTVKSDGALVTADKYDVSDGAIRFHTAPSASAVITATYDYYWKVYLKTDGIKIQNYSPNINMSENLELVTTE